MRSPVRCPNVFHPLAVSRNSDDIREARNRSSAFFVNPAEVVIAQRWGSAVADVTSPGTLGAAIVMVLGLVLMGRRWLTR